MKTCKKVFKDIPAAHRVHNHSGHCRFIHGHNFTIEVVFESVYSLTSEGFIIDFGELDFLKDWINDRIDHCLLVQENDPILDTLKSMDCFKISVVPSTSCEGLSSYVYTEFSNLVNKHHYGNVYVKSVTVYETSNNSAKYSEKRK